MGWCSIISCPCAWSSSAKARDFESLGRIEKVSGISGWRKSSALDRLNPISSIIMAKRGIKHARLDAKAFDKGRLNRFATKKERPFLRKVLLFTAFEILIMKKPLILSYNTKTVLLSITINCALSQASIQEIVFYGRKQVKISGAFSQFFLWHVSGNMGMDHGRILEWCLM